MRCALVELPTNVGSSTEALMIHARWHLYDGETLRTLMQRAPGGRSLTMEELGERVGLSKSKVGMLISGERPTVPLEMADSICAVLGVHRGALFFQPLPTPMGAGRLTGGSRNGRDQHERAVAEDADRGTHELGEHDRPIGPYRRRP
ncbi:hypothetical protein DMA15_12450 [Streptomyces sp. WAC 01529]|nr:hypothetical protein DMA15_12450 [Streptomyces sp. WAC 01529]